MSQFMREEGEQGTSLHEACMERTNAHGIKPRALKPRPPQSLAHAFVSKSFCISICSLVEERVHCSLAKEYIHTQTSNMFCTLRVAPASSPNKSKAVELSDEEQARATLKRLGRNSSALDAIQGVGYLEGKTALVTGANSGIGKETARALYVAGCNVIIGCRNTASGDEAVKDITNAEGKKSNTCTVVALDLSDLNSVLACARTIRETVPSLHILVLNAGAIVSSLERTKQGFEKGFGVNFVGHYLLTRELLPRITDSCRECPEGMGGRIVGMSSIAHMLGKIQLDDPNFETTKFSGWKSYGQSKLAMILFMKHLARTFEEQGTNIKAFSIHPGAIHTKLQQDTTYVNTMFKLFKYFCKTPEQGAATTVVACARGDMLQNGAYLVDCQEGTPARQARDLDMAAKLCDLTDRLIQEKMQPAI